MEGYETEGKRLVQCDPNGLTLPLAKGNDLSRHQRELVTG